MSIGEWINDENTLGRPRSAVDFAIGSQRTRLPPSTADSRERGLIDGVQNGLDDQDIRSHVRDAVNLAIWRQHATKPVPSTRETRDGVDIFRVGLRVNN